MSLPQAITLLATSARLVRAAGQNDIKSLASPCISVCQMDGSTGLCQGCLRTLDEIAQWSQLGPAAKRAIWSNIEARIALHHAPASAPTCAVPDSVSVPD